MKKLDFLKLVSSKGNWTEYHNAALHPEICPICGAHTEYQDIMLEKGDLGVQMLCKKCNMMYDVWYKYIYHASFRNLDINE